MNSRESRDREGEREQMGWVQVTVVAGRSGAVKELRVLEGESVRGLAVLAAEELVGVFLFLLFVCWCRRDGARPADWWWTGHAGGHGEGVVAPRCALWADAVRVFAPA